jgi:hypothetical protein
MCRHWQRYFGVDTYVGECGVTKELSQCSHNDEIRQELTRPGERLADLMGVDGGEGGSRAAAVITGGQFGCKHWERSLEP